MKKTPGLMKIDEIKCLGVKMRSGVFCLGDFDLRCVKDGSGLQQIFFQILDFCVADFSTASMLSSW
jgi:hypothetical protein